VVDNVVKLTRRKPFSSPADGWPAGIGETISVSSCHAHDVYLRLFDELGDVVPTNVVSGETCCEANCYGGRPGDSAGLSRKEGIDYPLALGWEGENPSRGIGAVLWSVPLSSAGVAYDLSVFDVAGRRVLTVARGSAKAGRFREGFGFRSEEGAVLRSGVFFLRLRIGRETLNKTIVLTR